MENQTNPNFFNSDKINEIKDLFLLITIHLNENIELKFNLLSKKDFSPTQLFDSLDNFSKKNLTVQDILHYLEHHNYKINTELIQRLIKQYDKNGNYNLIYDDFLQMISPFGLQVFSVNSLLGDKGENADEIFCQILINEIKLLGKIGEIISEIRKNNDFNCYKTFVRITNNEKFINKDMINNLMDGKLTEKEINQLIYYIDSDKDGLISYDDFHDLLLPIQNDLEIKIEQIQNNETQCNNNLIQENINVDDNIIDNNNINQLYIQKTYYLENKNEEKSNNNNGIENSDNNESNDEIEDSNKREINSDIAGNDLSDNKIIINNQNLQKESYTEVKGKTSNSIFSNMLNQEKDNISNLKENTFTFGQKYYNQKGKSFNYQNSIELISQEKKKKYFEQFNRNNYSYREDDIHFNNKENKCNNSDYFINQNVQQFEIIPKEKNYNTFTNYNYSKQDLFLNKIPITFGNNQDNIQSFNNSDINIMNNKNSNNYKDLKNGLIKNRYYKTKLPYSNLKVELNNNFDIKASYSNSLQNKFKSQTEPNIKETNGCNFPNLIEGINIFLQFINLIINNENKIEHIKENLALREDLSFMEIFTLFAQEQKNYISLNNFQFICKKILNLYPTTDQINLLFKRYKSDLKGNKEFKNYLAYNEFFKMISPTKKEYINLINKRNHIDKSNIKLSIKSKTILVELIKNLIQKETDYYKIKSKFDYSCIEQIWKEIAKYSKKKKEIDKNSLDTFLKEYGYFFYDIQFDYIFFIFDKEKNKKISYDNFIGEIFYDY